MLPVCPDLTIHVQYSDEEEGGSGGPKGSFENNLNKLVDLHANRPSTIHRKGGGMCIAGWMSGMGGAGKVDCPSPLRQRINAHTHYHDILL